jgi:hypothetical protein
VASRNSISWWKGGCSEIVSELPDHGRWAKPGHRVPIRYVLVRDPEGKLEPAAFLSTDIEADPLDILRIFVRRWSIQVTFAEVRRHLGVETQRQWSDLAIARTTPFLLGLFSLITLCADELYTTRAPAVRLASWYRKSVPTFSDALANIRRELWAGSILRGSSTALAEIDRFRRYFNELRKFTTLPTMLMASTEMFSLPR